MFRIVERFARFRRGHDNEPRPPISTANLPVSAPHDPLVLGRTPKMILRALAYAARGHFQS